jgi:hypothetical protein
MGLGDLDDRPLLDALEGECEAFVTVDRLMSAQQQLASRSFALIVMRARSNRLENLAPSPRRRSLHLHQCNGVRSAWWGG